MLTMAAVASATMPYHVLAVVPVWPWNTAGFAVVPLTVSEPLTVSSTLAVSSPDAWPSELANCTIVPALTIRKAPEGTVMSPWMM